jgi:hypothetical protein
MIVQLTFTYKFFVSLLMITQDWSKQVAICVTSGSTGGVNEVSDLLGCYAASICG